MNQESNNDPFAPDYQPKYNYEFHIQTSSNTNPARPIRYRAEFNLPLTKQASTRTMPGYTQTCEIELGFQGTIQSLFPVMPLYLKRNQEKIKKQCIQNIANFLAGVQLSATKINYFNVTTSEATLTFSAQGYTSNSLSITSHNASITASTDNNSVSLSTDAPTTIVFYFYNTELTAKNSLYQFTGNLFIQLTITIAPEAPATSTIITPIAIAGTNLINANKIAAAIVIAGLTILRIPIIIW